MNSTVDSLRNSNEKLTEVERPLTFPSVSRQEWFIDISADKGKDSGVCGVMTFLVSMEINLQIFGSILIIFFFFLVSSLKKNTLYSSLAKVVIMLSLIIC